MMRTFLTSAAILLALSLGTSAFADNYVYWFTVPVKLDRVAPPYTQLALDCELYANGWHGKVEIAIELDYAGKYEGSVAMQAPLTATSAQDSYKCNFEPLIGTSYQLPKSMLDGVTGTLPKHP